MSVPPKVVKAQVIRAGMPPGSENMDQGVLSLARHYGGSPARRRQSLPVLEAFQEFLDMERQRARRRLLMMTSFFIVLFVILGGATVVGGLLFYGAMADDLRNVRRDVASAEAKTIEMDQQTQTALNRFESDAVSWRDDVLQKTQQFLSKQTGLSEQIGKTGAEIRELREALEELRQENAAMQQRLAGHSEVQPPVTGMVEEPEPPVFLSVFIQPQGVEQPVPWRLAVP